MLDGVDQRLLDSAVNLYGRYGRDAVAVARQMASSGDDPAYRMFWRSVAGLIRLETAAERKTPDLTGALVAKLQESLDVADMINIPLWGALIQQALDIVRLQAGISWDEDGHG